MQLDPHQHHCEDYMCDIFTRPSDTLDFSKLQIYRYRYMYLKKAWYLKTYMDSSGSITYQKLHYIKNWWLFGINKT